MQKVVCFATLLAAASAQISQPNLVPTLFDQVAGSGIACGDTIATTRASIGNCMSYGTSSVKFTTAIYITDCDDDEDEATTWFMDYWKGSTDCTGQVTRTKMVSGECYRLDFFAVRFETTLGAVAACKLAGMQRSLYGQKMAITEYTNGKCEGGPSSVNGISVFPQSSAAVAVGASKCTNLCDGFCCRQASADCVLSPGSYKLMMTCFRGKGVFALEQFIDNACATQASKEEYVIGQCNEISDVESKYITVTPSVEVVGYVCSYTPAEGVILTSESSQSLAIVGSDIFAAEITQGSAIFDTIASPAGAPALSLLVAIAAVCALML
ncbi:hypothetical protein DIPPA_15019 [Diplonema papillatum]|nr:hypothetical protein DIPPA_15019 [Diplonema papillatum]